MKKLLITGGQGYIGSLVNYFNKDKYIVTKLGRNELNLEDISLIESTLLRYDFDIVLHAGAIPDTKTCEKYPEMTYKVNVQSTKKISDVCKKMNKKLMFISSEQVYNGLNIRGPHSEKQQTKSVSVYGNHKIECEKYIEALDFNAVVVRFGWMFGLGFEKIKPSYNIITPLIKALVYQKPTKFTVNERRGFTYSHNFATLFPLVEDLPSGLYNFSAKNHLNTYETAKRIAELLSFDKQIIDKYVLPDTNRYRDQFRDFAMDNAKLKSYGIDLKNLDFQVEQLKEDFGWIENE